MTNPTLNDLTCALTAGVVRDVQRDLSGVHDSDKCDCRWCRWADGRGARGVREVSKAVPTPETSLSEPQGAGIDTSGDVKGSLWADAATIRVALTQIQQAVTVLDDLLTMAVEAYDNQARKEM